MKSRTFGGFCKNAVGTVFLLAAAFFVCSTLVSMRAVLADPIAPAITAPMAAQSTRAGTPSRAPGRTNATSRASGATTARTTAAPSRSVTSRSAVRTTTANSAAPLRSTGNTASRATAGRTTTATGRGTATTTRGVTSRNSGAVTSRGTNATTARNVVARTATTGTNARVSLQGSAIRGSTTTGNSTYTYLSSKLYTGNYSNIIDSTTGLISADAYSNCLESYYACMDEICTARNASQGRCACAERTKSFAKAQEALNQANEELIQLSGQLALLVATKGKDVSAAFQLTDAEKVMNCVSWKEMNAQYSNNTDKQKEWYNAHGIYDDTKFDQPDYCTKNTFGFDIDSISDETSEITALLVSWDKAKTEAGSATEDNTNDLLDSYANLVQSATNIGLVVDGANGSKDKLTTLWGSDLFEYAHNNICGRVLDSCFNGIYEACGSVPSGGRCADGSTTSPCAYNYNSKVSSTTTKDKAGETSVKDVAVNDRSSTGTGAGTNTGATCYGYSSTSGDPYSSLRGPVADARRSVLQKYLLDANAACDAYGEQLTTTAQNIAYQKVAAQQALQKKRLEFAQEEEAATLADVSAAKQNYINCLDEIQQCRYDIQRQYANQGWTTNRIRSYCNTKTQVPTCYETMVCDQNATRVITADDVLNNKTTETLVQNAVTLTDILSMNDDSARSKCINQDMNVSEIRNFGSTDESSQACVPNHGTLGYQNWDKTNLTWGECQATQCDKGYRVTVVGSNRRCMLPDNANESPESNTVNDFVPLVGAKCQNGYIAVGGNCVAAQCSAKNAAYSEQCTADKTVTSGAGCVSTGCLCMDDMIVADGKCIFVPANATFDANAKTLGDFVPVAGARCNAGFYVQNGACVSAQCEAKGATYDTSCTTNGGSAACVSVGCLCPANKVLAEDKKSCVDKPAA